MKKIGFVFILLVSSTIIYGQNEASYWYFGEQAGLRFDASTNDVTVLNGELNTREGCASISDSDGQLLFYTDGSFVWDRNGNLMPNGSGLYGDPSSTQSAIIIPKPNNENIYYIFTVDTSVFENDPDFGLNYSEVDVTLNGGLGDVIIPTKNTLLLQDSSEKISAVLKDCLTEHIYVITLASQDGSPSNSFTHFHIFEVTTTGITTLTPQSIGAVINDPRGYLKFSPDGTKLVSANMSSGLFLYDFDVLNGTVSNPIQLQSPSSINIDRAYGVEFSQNNQFLYISFSNDLSGVGSNIPSNHNTALVQYNLYAPATSNFDPIVINEEPSNYRGALQLALDGKIYRALSSTYFLGKPNLAIINNPDALGTDCNYDPIGISISPNSSSQGLPPFIQSLFNSQIDIIRNGISATELKLCTGGNYTLQADDIAGADYTWLFNNTPLAETSAQLFVDTPGFYEVFIEPNNGSCPIEGKAVIGIFDIPIANPLSDVIICDNAVNDGSFSFDFTSKNSETLLTQNPDEYNVHYFQTLNDANTSENEITFPYINTSNSQTIFVRVDNSENTDCFDINSFELEILNTPQIVQLNTIEFCDNIGDLMDGIATVELGDLITTIRGSQDETQTSITFHPSQEDADANSATLPLSYTNTTAFNETIFVRIENTANTACYSTGSFELIINDIPIANDLSIIQCDEDGIPEGFTTYNINQVIDDIIEGASNRAVKFYTSQINAENEEDEINGDAFNNYFNPQTLYARVTNTSSGCFNISQVSLEISTTSSNNASLFICDDDGNEDGFTTFNLSDTNAIVLAGAPAGLNLQYYESYEDALLETDPLNTNYTNSVPYSQTIYARIENSNACYGISEVELTVLDLPNIETEFETHYCLNFYPETIVINGGVIEDLPSNYSYEWSTGEDTSEIEVNSPGTYTVRVFNTDGCFKDRTITVLPSNIASITDIQIIDASENNSISVLVSGEGNYEYALDNINGPYQDNNTFEDVSAGLYTVYVRDKNNCGIIEDLISVIGFPKFFTPNEDGKNDYWQVNGISSQFQTNSSILIFDRHGKLLKKLDPLNRGWDGTYNGTKLPTSDYWFKVKLQDGRTFTNHFTLKR